MGKQSASGADSNLNVSTHTDGNRTFPRFPEGEGALLRREQFYVLTEAALSYKQSANDLANALETKEQEKQQAVAAAIDKTIEKAADDFDKFQHTRETIFFMICHSTALVFGVMGLIGQLYSTEDVNGEGFAGIDYTNSVVAQCYYILALMIVCMSLLGLLSTIRMTKIERDQLNEKPDISLAQMYTDMHWSNRLLGGLGFIMLVGSFIALMQICIATGMEADFGGLVGLEYESDAQYRKRALAMTATFLFSGICLANAKQGGEDDVREVAIEKFINSQARAPQTS